MQLWPQTLLNVRIQRGFDWQSSTALLSAKQAAEAALGSEGRVLIRPSGTEPLLRVMVEARDAVLARSLAEQLVESVAA